jgi:ketosteroid isomerase-like protein
LAVRPCPLAVAAIVTIGASSTAVAQAPSSGQVAAGQTTITLPDTSAYSPVARRLLALERERSAAIARHDTAWLATLYASDFRGVVANGRRVDRAALFRVFSMDSPSSRFLIDELEVRDLGAAAMVTGRLRTATLAGEVVAESRYLHVYVERGAGHWWLVSAQGTAVARAR